MIINVRGTGGSGKSHLVLRVMDTYQRRDSFYDFETMKKRPMACECLSPDKNSLYVPGHYETACGGCDTIKTVDQVYVLVRTAAEQGLHVLYEGIMVGDDVVRAVALSRTMTSGFVVIALTTSIEDCLSSIRERRLRSGNQKPLNEKNTRDRHRKFLRRYDRLVDAGVVVEKHDRESAFLRIRELLA